LASKIAKVSSGRRAFAELSPSDFTDLTRSTMLVSAASESAFETAIGRSAQEKDEYWNSAAKVRGWHDGTQWNYEERSYIRRDGAAGFTRTSTSTFTVTDNSDNQGIFKPGLPLAYRTSAGSGAFSYGIIKSYSSGTVTIMGVALPSTVGELRVGPSHKVVQVSLQVAGELAVGDDQLKTVMATAFRWLLASGYLVGVRAWVETAAAGANLLIQLGIGAAGQDLLSSQLSLGQATTEVDSGVTISNTYYNVDFLDKVFLNVDQVGSTTAGEDLTVELISVLPELGSMPGTPMEADTYPHVVTCFQDEAVAEVGTLAVASNNDSYYEYSVWNDSANDLDERSHEILLRAGSWTIYVMGKTFTSRPYVDIMLDSTVKGTQDWYGGDANNVVKTTSFTVSKSNRYKLRLKINGNNPSSSGYIFFATKVWLIRTGD